MLQQKSDLEPFLARLTSRSRLTPEEQQAILNLPTHIVQVQAHRDFVPLGERSNHACVVVEGLVGRFGQTAEGARQITALHIPGDAPDLHSVVQPRARSALQALVTTTLLLVPHTALRAVAAKYPAVAEAFWRDCMVDAGILAQWVVNVGRRNAQTRMAHLLCEMATRYRARQEQGPIEFEFPVTQTQLADVTALTAVHVNRTLKALRREGLASISGRTVRITDWEALAKVAEFDGGYLDLGTDPEERLRIVEAA